MKTKKEEQINLFQQKLTPFINKLSPTKAPIFQKNEKKTLIVKCISV